MSWGISLPGFVNSHSVVDWESVIPAPLKLSAVSLEHSLFGTIDDQYRVLNATQGELFRKEFGRLDITYNNAGLPGALGSIEQTSVEDWDRTFAVLTRGVFLGIKHSVPEMRKVGGGSIISTASMAGLAGGYGPHAYSAAKAGVVNLTRSVALEVAKDKIRVNCICPGGINTPIFNFLTSDREVTGQLLGPLHPLRRAGLPEDIANMALFLASDESEWITGVAMVVDGGLTAGREIFGDPQFGGGMYSANVYVGPSFEIKR